MIFFNKLETNGYKNGELVGTDLVGVRAVVPTTLDLSVGPPTGLDFDFDHPFSKIVKQAP